MVYLIFIAALIPRLIYIIQLKSTIFYSHFLLDEAFYNNWAQEIARGDWLGKEVFSALPLYPYMLGIIYKIFGYNLFIPRLITVLVSSLNCVIIYFIAKRLFSKRAAAIAGLTASFYSALIFYTGTLIPTTFTVFFFLLSAATFLRAEDRPSFFRFSVFGFVSGLGALLRPGILLFFTAMLIRTFSKSKQKRQALGFVSAAIIGLIIVIMPVTVRNYILSKEVVFLTSHAGMNFYIGNNEEADGTFKPPEWARSNIEGLRADAEAIAEKEAGRQLSDAEVSAHYANKAYCFIRQMPQKFLALLGRKLMLFVNKQEFYDVAYYQAYREHIPILRFPFITFLIVGSLGLAGACIGIKHWNRFAPLYFYSLTYAASIIAYFVNSRYRVPFAMAMIIFTGFFIDWLLEKFKNRQYRLLIAGACLIIIFGIIVSVPTGISTDATAYANLGNLYMETGELNEAIGAFNKAIKYDETDPKPYNDIGLIYIMQDKLAEAEDILLKALAKSPDYPFAHVNLGLVYEKRGGLSLAETEYKKAIELNPNIPQAHNNLANIYAKTNRHSLAIDEYNKTIELDPQNAGAHYNLGVIYIREDMPDKAKKEFEKSLELNPDFTPARKALRNVFAARVPVLERRS